MYFLHAFLIFEERRRAVVALVRDIQVVHNEIDGKTIPIVTNIYWFNEPTPIIPVPQDALTLDYTLRRAVQFNNRWELAKKLDRYGVYSIPYIFILFSKT